jgi:two-component system aerobic respiration control sensor histidine kinase ArcB
MHYITENLVGSIVKKEDHFNVCLLGIDNPALLLSMTGEIVHCNQSLLDIYQLHEMDCFRKNYFEVCQFHQIQPAFPSLEALKETKINRGRSRHSEAFAPIIIQWTKSKIKQAHLSFFLLMGVDVSDLVNDSTTEKKIQLSIIDCIPNYYIFWKNIHSVYLGCNEALAKSLQLPSSSAIVGKTDYDLPTTKEQSDAYRADDKDVMSTRQAKFNIEERQTLPDGSERVLLTSKVPLFDGQGNVYGIVGIYSDITESKNMQIALEQAKNQAEAANRAKTAFIANMSHDIRTPLTGIVGISELLEQDVEGAERRRYAQWINQSGHQLLNLLNSILEVVSSENISETAVYEEPFDLRQGIRDIVQLQLPTVKLKNLSIESEVDNAIPNLIVSDRTKLHRILLNLVSNAIKFTHQGSIIINAHSLWETKESVKLRVTVADTGIGIPDALQDRVFDRFFRATPSYKGTFTGHGVGLNIVQSYVRLLGGDISFISKEGVGTTFMVELELKKMMAKSKSTKMKSESSVYIQKPLIVSAFQVDSSKTQQLDASLPRVLLIEDNPIAMQIAKIAIHAVGCNLKVVDNGEQALILAQSEPFDLIISDIGLPGMSGYEFTRRFRHWELTHQKVPIMIVGLTAHAKETALKEGIDAGMDDLFTKPMTPQVISFLKQKISSLKTEAQLC